MSEQTYRPVGQTMLGSRKMSEHSLVGRSVIGRAWRLVRPEVLRILRHYLQAQSQQHSTVDGLGERGVGKGSGPTSYVERVRRNKHQTDTGTLGQLPGETRSSAHGLSRALRCHRELN